MPNALASKGSPFTSEQRTIVAGASGAMLALLICLFGLGPKLAAIPAAVIGIGVIWAGLRYTVASPQSLICVLALIELFTGAWFLSGAARAVLHYGLVALFCLPLLPAAWRNRSFLYRGFGLYSCYFLWAGLTVLYSLAPEFSAGRLLDALLIFGASSLILSRVNRREEIQGLLMSLLIGCAIVMGIVALSGLVLPKSVTWMVPTDSSGEVFRFTGIFDGPNAVGELMLVTVGCASVLWPSARGRWRLLLAVLIGVALGAAGLADSRTPFVALAVGGGCFLGWKYRARAVVLLLVIVLAASMAHFNTSDEGYFARGDVGTLTGRTEIWSFAFGRIEDHPVLGYGYEVAGAIFDSRYFPLWWGPWDEGPHSSLHDGYIDRAVGVGVPATLLWLFIVLRPWYDIFRRREDPWGIKPVAFWIVIPMLVHNLTEASITDFTSIIGLSFGLVWMIAERARMRFEEQDEEIERRELAKAPPALAALLGVLAAAALIIAPRAARAQPSADVPSHFPTLPPHAALPSGAQCAMEVRNGRSWEPRSTNSAANQRVPTSAELTLFHLKPIKGSFVPAQDFARVDGQFTGTTDQILRWGACKWGIDEDVVRAEAVAESHWRQDDTGDSSNDLSRCPPGRGFSGAWDGTGCKLSYGIMQMKFTSFNGWPLSKDSTAFNVDFRLAYQRACMNGDISYLRQQTPAGNHPAYPDGTTGQMLWGCMGDWFSGSWYDPGALRYIAEVKSALADRTWAKAGF
ncbi:MAG: O-antigen ligase family protein [Candidatus Binataceae bacterium]